MKTFADAEARLAEALPDYEVREPQQRLAQQIERIFDHAPNFTTRPIDADEDWEREDVLHGIGQAGTGVGKSLAYLIPAILSGKRVVVSVTTKALQDQLVTVDIPFLEHHLGVPVHWALLKGRSNYLCMQKAMMVTATDVPGLVQIIEACKDPEFDGLREHLPVEVSNAQWAALCSESEDCNSNKCDSSNCYAERARGAAARADLVVANHALFMTDLLVKSWGMAGMLGEYQLVVFDEAHTLEEVAGNTLGAQITEGSFGALTSQLRRWGSEFGDDSGEAMLEPMGVLVDKARTYFSVLKEGRIRMVQLNESVNEMGDVIDALESLRVALKETTYENTADPTRASKRKRMVANRLRSLSHRFQEVITSPMDEMVRWVEMERQRDGSQRKVLKTAPILVSPFLTKYLFSKVPAVLVSATLAVNGSFDYITNRLGVWQQWEGLDVGTPFDYPSQGRIYVPTHLPAPKGSDQAEWQGMALQEIHRIVTASRGRTLVLFTSYAHMKSTHDALVAMPGDLDYRMQGQRPTPELIDWLKDHTEHEHGKVLLATKSFFTGVNIPGEALTTVIVTKMPFPVPTEPLTEARCEAIDMAGGSSFKEYSIPMMSLELQQGTGRLIRHRNDRGVVVVLDPRLVTTGYGQGVLRDLPPMTRLTSLGALEEFYAELAAEGALV